MATLTPNTLGKKKKAALRVFGESLVTEYDNIDSSLTYSTASEKSMMSNMVNDENNDPHTNLVSVPQCINTTTPSKMNPTSPPRPPHPHHATKTVSFAVPTTESDQDIAHNTKHNSQSRELFHCKRSPLRPDLVRRTQEAIRKATISVNETMLLGQSDKNHYQSTSADVSEMAKEEWREQIQEAREFNNQIQGSRLRMLALRKELSSKGSREKARLRQAHKSKSLTKIEKESQFKSYVFREQQKRLKEEEENRRRMSIEARARLRANANEGKERLRMQRIDEEMAIIEERHEASIARRQRKANDAASRRKSFAFRNGDARRIRELHRLMQAEAQQKEQKDFALQEQTHRDMQEYKRKLEEDRRRSLAQRNAAANKQRKEEEAKRAKEEEEQHQSYELKFSAERDAEAYKRKLEEERRLSLGKRLDEARRQRLEEEARRAAESKAEHENYELKNLGEKDAEDYRATMAEERRMSLQNRGKRHLQQREVELKLREQQLTDQHSSFELKRAAEKDAEAYLRELADARRQSLAFRNQEGRRIRELESRQLNDEFIKQHESFELQMAAARDADEYKKQQEAARRESLAFRNHEGRKQRQQASQFEAALKEAEHASYDLKWAGENDTQEAQKQMEEERRKSLANRNAERHRHANVMNELRQIALEKESESLALKWAGEKDAKEYLAKLEQERRESLQLRGKQILEARAIEDEFKTKELIQQHEDENIRSKDYKAVKEYEAQCAERDRKSLSFRGKETNRQRLERQQQESIQRQQEHANFQLEELAQKDVEEYLKDCRRRRRMSLAFRAKEKRRHAEWKRTQEEKEVRERRNLVHGRLMDQRYVELAQQEERTKQALEAIRHSNRTTTNPFSGLL